jgi:Zn-dependent peptidase ImmA (M78 family)/DNA-binding XRE family transcriptional regulator
MENSFAYKLKELREKSSFSLQDLADQVGVAKQSIHKFESGLASPSSETLLKIADALNVSYSLFYENTYDKHLSVDNIRFREKHKINNLSLENEIKEEICRYLSKLMELAAIIGEEMQFENPLEGFAITSEKDIEKAAKMVRKKWKIGNAPIIDVVETLETQGVGVIEVSRLEDFSGLSVMVNEEIPVIVLNEHFNSLERKRFTALHELGHIVLEFEGELSEKKIEHYCDVFAGAVLLVDDVLCNELGKDRTVITLAELRRIKELYGISIQAIIMRASNSGLIDNTTSRAWWKHYEEWYSSDQNTNDFGKYRGTERPQQFKNMVLRGVAEKRLSVSKAAELAGKKVDIMRKELNEINFKVKQ